MAKTALHNSWHVVRTNKHSGRIEYLDKERDVFYYSGVEPFATKLEATTRARAVGPGIKLSDLRLKGPMGGLSIVTKGDAANKHANVLVMRLQYMERVALEAHEPETKEQLLRELGKTALDATKELGVFGFGNMGQCRLVLRYVMDYGEPTDHDWTNIMAVTREK